MLTSLKPAVLVLWLLLGSHVLAIKSPVCEDTGTVFGVNRWGDALHCCTKEGRCFNNNVDDLVRHKIQSELPDIKPSLQRSKGFDPSQYESRNLETEMPCCDSKVSIIYPLSGLLAFSAERVGVVQLGPLRQPVAYEVCEAKPCRFLRGNCTQVYHPVPLYVLADNGRDAKLDYVLVESGCRCSQPEEEDRYPYKMGVDRVVKEALREITGREFNSDELLGHQGVNLKNNTSNLNTQAVLNATSESRTTEDPVTQPVESVTETTRLTPLVEFSTSTKAPSTTRRPLTVKTTRTTTVKMTKLSTTALKTTQTLASSTSTPTVASTVESTTNKPTTEAITVLPLPSLPPPGQPIEIKPGFFNPMAIFLRPKAKLAA